LKKTGFKESDIHKLIPLLRKQVNTLKVPYLEELTFRERNPFKVLISCILSLRTQDRTTGEASRRLFSLASTPSEMASLSVDSIRDAIYPVGFYKVKAERIKAISETIMERYNGQVPDSIDELLKLKGVGRKTANLVLTLGWDKYGICVDTHVHRITNRWGYVNTRTPEETEFALREKLPRRYWKEINGLLVTFGQGICKPISPLCSRCSIHEFCGRNNLKRHR
jgi:endonuclease-3